jgi:hypothetical protein
MHVLHSVWLLNGRGERDTPASNCMSQRCSSAAISPMLMIIAYALTYRMDDETAANARKKDRVLKQGLREK